MTVYEIAPPRGPKVYADAESNVTGGITVTLSTDPDGPGSVYLAMPGGKNESVSGFVIHADAAETVDLLVQNHLSYQRQTTPIAALPAWLRALIREVK